jgi:membrane glycosyltransferase
MLVTTLERKRKCPSGFNSLNNVPDMTPPQSLAPITAATASDQPVRTAPPMTRAPMRARPWAGLLRGSLTMLLLTLFPSLKFSWQEPAAVRWAQSARRRRRTLLLVVMLFAVMALYLLMLSAPAQPSALWMVYVTLGVLLTAWVGAGTATALMGAVVLLRGGDRFGLTLANPRAPIEKSARTAVIMPICNEDVATVFSGLRATCESLASTGALGVFDFYLLSDTTDPAIAKAELQAWERLRAFLGDKPMGQGARVFYRLRRRRGKRKAGNVEDFCRRWGAGYRYMVVLDADSAMHGETLVNLVRLMEEHPKAGIIQTLPQAYGHSTLHARTLQFSTRVTGRIFALGMAYWQLGDSHYWGHNAILRVEPFMRHCALAPIKGRGSLAGDILSHDFVEAAMMGRAGYEVWLAPQLEGSWEQLPPNLLDELDRDRRWCRGNLQNAQLIAEPGWKPVHRVMFGVGALSYLMGPIWLLFVVLGLWAGSMGSLGDQPDTSMLWALTLALLLTPRALGVLAVRLRGEQARYGGTLRLIASAGLELLISALQAPVRMLAYAAFSLNTLTGLKLEWRSPPRDAHAVSWGDAFKRLSLYCLPLLALGLWVFSSDALTAPHLAPLWVPLLLAMPLAVISSQVRWGAALQRWRMLWVPEEAAPPPVLVRAMARRGFTDLVPATLAAAPAVVKPVVVQPVRLPPVYTPARHSKQPRPAFSLLGNRLAPAFAAAVLFALTGLLPPQADNPSLSPQLRVALDTYAAMAAQQEQESEEDEVMARIILASDKAEPPRPRVRTKPARMIDDEIRQRAREAVRRSLEGDYSGEPTVWEVSRINQA